MHPSVFHARRHMLVAAGGLLLLAAGCSARGAAGEAGHPPAATAPSPSSSAVPAAVAGAKGWLAYQSRGTSGDDGVFLVHTDGSSDHEVLTGIPGRHNHPDFSRDGKRLAFDQLTSEQDSSQVYVADADGAHARRLPPCRTPKCAGHWEPAWSPDGTRLAVSIDIGAPPG